MTHAPNTGAPLLRERTPIVVGCTGGSGSRVVAQVLQRNGCCIGRNLNFACDNMDFAFCLGGRLTWLQRHFPFAQDRAPALHALDLFEKLYFSQPLGPADRLHFARIAAAYLHPRNLRLLGTRSPLQRLRSAAGLLLKSHPEPTAATSQPDIAWGFKLPGSILLLHPLIDAYPELRFVHLVRNGKDMALSSNQKLLLHYASLFDLPQKPDTRNSFELWSRMNRWAHDVTAERMPTDRVLVLRFEDLCRDPGPTIDRLLAFANLPLRDSAVYDLPRPIDSIGRWKQAPGSFNGLDTSTLELFGY